MAPPDNKIPWLTLTGTAVAAVATFGAYQLVSEYGIRGALMYVWEGDPYGPALSKMVHSLDQTERSRVSQEILINQIEEALERARLDSVDDDKKATKELVTLWAIYFQPRNLEKSLAGLSHELDRLAAQVDGVLLTAVADDSPLSARNLLEDLKRRKKAMSKQLVLHMERCDALMASYQVLQETDQ